MRERYCIVMTAFSNKDIGQKIIDGLIENRLAACVQAMPIQSTYHWEGAVHNENETLILIKTKESLYSKVEEFIKSNHDYDCPEIIQIPIDAGFGGYLKWIESECK